MLLSTRSRARSSATSPAHRSWQAAVGLGMPAGCMPARYRVSPPGLQQANQTCDGLHVISPQKQQRQRQRRSSSSAASGAAAHPPVEMGTMPVKGCTYSFCHDRTTASTPAGGQQQQHAWLMQAYKEYGTRSAAVGEQRGGCERPAPEARQGAMQTSSQPLRVAARLLGRNAQPAPANAPLHQ